ETASHADLDGMAGRVARGLRAAGVAPGDLVAVRLGPGVQLIATLLGVLKAGAAFLPIGLDEPSGRVRALLDRSSPRLLVCAGDEPGYACRPVARLMEEPDAEEVPPPRSEPDSLAYALRTSGSTGEPKVVLVEHGGIVNAVRWKCGEYGLSGGHRMLPLFGCAFDGFILNVFAPLAAGAAVVLMEEGAERDPRAIAETIERHRVTHLAAAPIVYRAVLGQARAGRLGSLTSVTLAGDVAHPDTLSRSAARVSNEYGPAECSVVAAYAARIGPRAPTVIGRPIDNADVYVLDPDRRLLPPGITGEVYIGGAGLARGYLGDEELSRREFVEWRDRRLYRTGDLARWLPDGTLEYRGRDARHLKIRGVRANLGEVTRCLLDHPRVSDAVVTVAGEDAIGAAVVLEGEASGLAGHLATRLPPHLMPACLLPVPEIPLLQSGKPDLAAITLLLEGALGVGDAQPPATSIERDLVGLWRDILRTDDVGVNQSFFALGGHSLTATVLLAEIHERFGVELSLNEVFARSTVRELAAAIAGAAGGGPTGR
ncbi:non-ribosomal peptide synthetase, partial [Nonomuraea lactucae]|uniref:non-ribosomal peptide synthetase n=1 Tax=Nonomuraea lactucae TaxID=2249762 RepID=UPI000DE3992E